MGNRSRWWPFGRRKTEVGDQYTMIATAELRRERAEKAMAIRERDRAEKELKAVQATLTKYRQ